jgi:ferrous iron transport protein B
MNAEISDRKWFWGGIGLQLGVGYSIGFSVYQIGTLITTGGMGAGFVPGLIAVAVMVGIVIWLCVRADSKLKAEYAVNGKK